MDSCFTYYHHDQSLLRILADGKPGDQWPRTKLPEKLIVLPEETHPVQDHETEPKIKKSGKGRQFVWNYNPVAE